MDILRQHRVKFVQNLHSVPSVIDHLVSAGVLTRGNKNTITSSRNVDDQVRMLLDISTRKGPKVLKPLYDTLVITGNADLAELLQIDTGGPSSLELEQKQYKVLVLQGDEEITEIKGNKHFERDDCTGIIDKIKKAASSPDLENMVVFILGNFNGNSVEELSRDKISISEICATLVEVLPGKEKVCILLHPKDATELSSYCCRDPHNKCLLVALSGDRLTKLLKEFKRPDNFLSSITKFIDLDEIIWPVPGYILLLDGPEENKEIQDFLRDQQSVMKFQCNTKTCSRIETKLKDVRPLQNASYFIVFLLGQFTGTEVKDVFSDHVFHITKICVTMKEILPGIPKICILLQADHVKTETIGLDKENNSVRIVSLTNERLTNLIKELNRSKYIPSCIENFVLDTEKIW